VFAAVQVMMPLWVRPHLMPPQHVSAAFNPANVDEFTTNYNGSYMAVTDAVNLPGAWIIANQSLTPAGRVFTGPAPAACMRATNSMTPCDNALGRLGLRQYVTYQPASRYWAFQAYETAIFVVLAAGLGACCAVLIRRRAA
jgi:hypothetical protein